MILKTHGPGNFKQKISFLNLLVTVLNSLDKA